MTTACSLVPPRFEDGRHEAFLRGLAAAGFEVAPRPEHAEVLVTWNRHRAAVHRAALDCEARGGRVVVCEEAYTRRLVPGPHFAMALDGHNGSGRWFPGGPERWRRLGLPLAPWQRHGEHILICAARGMGAPGLREPAGWADDVCRRLRAVTDRPVVLRRHPGKGYAARPLECDLEGAWAVVVWTSNAATQALVAGVPAFFEGPAIVTEGAAERGIAGIEVPARPERLPVFERLAWAQWTLDEIAGGDAVRHLIQKSEVRSQMTDVSEHESGPARMRRRLARVLRHGLGRPRRLGRAVEVGARDGVLSIELLRLFDRVIAFEPLAARRAAFRRNVGSARAELVPCALGLGTGTLRMQDGLERVAMRRLDDFALDAPLDLLAVDCGSGTPGVLRGAERTLRRHRPLVMLKRPGDDAVDYLSGLGAALLDEIDDTTVLDWEIGSA